MRIKGHLKTDFVFFKKRKFKQWVALWVASWVASRMYKKELKSTL